jgi:outer membrane biosynthesis protein TonB
MKRTQAVAVTGSILLGALLFGAQYAAAAPTAPGGDAEIALPTAPPEPEPCRVQLTICDLTNPTLELPTDVANPTFPSVPTQPPESTQPAEPTEPTQPAESPVVTTTQQTEVPAGAPQAAPVPRPNRIDTGSGPSDPVDPLSWWLIAVPVLAVLAMAAAGAFLWIQRSERRPS